MERQLGKVIVMDGREGQMEEGGGMGRRKHNLCNINFPVFKANLC